MTRGAFLSRPALWVPEHPGAVDVLVIACEFGSSTGRRGGDAVAAAVVRGPGGNGLEVRRDIGGPPEAFRREVRARHGDLASAAVLAALQRFDHGTLNFRSPDTSKGVPAHASTII